MGDTARCGMAVWPDDASAIGLRRLLAIVERRAQVSPHDRCMHKWPNGQECGLWRDCHSSVPFKEEYAHEFEPASPSPPTENARAGADEACTREDVALSTAVNWELYPKLAAIFELRPRLNVYWLELVRLAFDLTASMHKRWADEAYSAGRARGIEEERKRCEGIARTEASFWSSLPPTGESEVDVAVAHRRRARREEADQIADAIAKETK